LEAYNPWPLHNFFWNAFSFIFFSDLPFPDFFKRGKFPRLMSLRQSEGSPLVSFPFCRLVRCAFPPVHFQANALPRLHSRGSAIGFFLPPTKKRLDFYFCPPTALLSAWSLFLYPLCGGSENIQLLFSALAGYPAIRLANVPKFPFIAWSRRGPKERVRAPHTPYARA